MNRRQYSAASDAGAMLILLASTFAIYIVTSFVIARIAGGGIAVLSADVASPAWSRPVVLVFGVSGVAIALVVAAVPWVLGIAGTHLRAATIFSRAFAVNLIQATAFVSLWKAFAGHTPPRSAFVAWQALVAAVGLVVMIRNRRNSEAHVPEGARTLLAGALVILVILPALLWGKTFVEDRSGDGTEAFEFSRSLATHQVPYWDLENGYYGFYPQFMLFAYPAQLSFIVIGETEAGQRLPVFFYVLGIYLVAAELVRRRRRQLSVSESTLLLGAAISFLLFHAHYSTYELVPDLAEPTGVDTFFTFLAASAFYALVTKQRVWWGLFALLGSMALAAGLPFAVLFLLGYLAVERRPRRWTALRGPALDALAFIVPWTVFQVFVAIHSRFNPLGDTKWDPAMLFETYSLKFDRVAAFTLLVGFVLVVAIVPLLGLAVVRRRDRISQRLRVLVIGYVMLLLLFGRANPHYLIPFGLFPAVILLRTLARPSVSSRARTTGYLAYGTAMLLLVARLPWNLTPHTAYRQFGRETLMLYDSYPAVVDATAALIARKPELDVYLPDGKLPMAWGRLPKALVIDRPVDIGPPGLSHHLWISYSDREPVAGRTYHQILATASLAPGRIEGFARYDLSDGWALFYRPGQSIFTSVARHR